MLIMSDSDIILKVENLSKTYFSKHQPQRSIKDLITSPFEQDDEEADKVEALKDVSFELKRGESLGIIGPNGAGKSTLLKILSGVTSPTSGKVTINGRVLSVLDIGTGFHPDLTGRENVYLNGEILGMSRKEIDKKYKEIVEFSGIEEFIDRPVKQYSSGMYLRLAFSIVVTLDADLLLFDEVMAVGDSVFMEKSINKVYGLLNANKSIILVTHNNIQVMNFSALAMFLQNGRVSEFNKSADVIRVYKQSQREERSINLSMPPDEHSSAEMKEVANDSSKDEASDFDDYSNSVSEELIKATERANRTTTGVQIKEIQVKTRSHKNVDRLSWEDSISIIVEYQLGHDNQDYGIAVVIKDSGDQNLIALHNLDSDRKYRTKPGVYKTSWTLPPKLFGPSTFFIDVVITKDGKIHYRKSNQLTFTVNHVRDTISDYKLLIPIFPELLKEETTCEKK